MNTHIDLMKKFPAEPDCKFFYIVYDHAMRMDVLADIQILWGSKYSENYVSVLTLEEVDANRHILIGNIFYVDPRVHLYKSSWNN